MIEILKNGVIVQVTIEKEDIVRKAYIPGMSIDLLPEDVKSVAINAWTIEVINQYHTCKELDGPGELEVTMSQARTALLEMGMLDSVNLYINSLGEREKIAWEFSSTLKSSNEIFKNAVLSLNKTNEEVKEFFKIASRIH